MRDAVSHHTWPKPSQFLNSSPNQLCPQFIHWAQHHAVWNIPLDIWARLSFLCPLPAPCAPQPHHRWGNVRNWKVFVSWCKPWLATTRTAVSYQHYSHPKSKTQNCTSYWEENKTYLSETRTLYAWFHLQWLLWSNQDQEFSFSPNLLVFVLTWWR